MSLRTIPHPGGFDSILSTRERFETNRNEGSLALPFAPISEALAETPDAPAWAWEGYLGPGVLTVLAGRPKVGKSTLFFGLLESLATGDPLLGLPVRRGGALLLSEERQASLNDKLQHFPHAARKTHLLMRYQARGVDWPTVVELAAAHCLSHGLSVMAIDTADKWFSLDSDGENSSGKIIEAISPLMWAAAQGLAVLIVAHQRKSDGSHGDAIRGSNALAGAVDVIMEVERIRGNGDRTARILRASSRFSGTPDELVFSLTPDGYEARGSYSNYSAEELEQRVLGVVTPTGVVAHDVSEVCDISATKAYKVLTRLAERGAVSREGAGTKGSPFRFFPPGAYGNETNTTPLRLIPEEEGAA